MYFDSILAVSDFTALSAHALERAALLARQHQTTLRLVHFADSPKTYLADPIARRGQRALRFCQTANSASVSTLRTKRSPWRCRTASMRRMSQMSVPMP